MGNLDYKSDLWVSPQLSQLYSEIEIPTLAKPNSNVLELHTIVFGISCNSLFLLKKT